MMSKEDFIESQKDCAAMLGMTLNEYQEYCKNTKVPKEDIVSVDEKDNTKELLDYLGIQEGMLKRRKKKMKCYS